MLAALSPAQAEDPRLPPPPRPLAFSDQDVSVDERMALLRATDGEAAAQTYLLKKYRSKPTPHVHAVYAEGVLARNDPAASPIEEETAMAELRHAADAGSTHAKAVLGWQSITGEHCPVDISQGIALLTQAANGGDAKACGWLAQLYLTGRGVPRTEFLANQWAERAAFCGNSDALYQEGQVYDLGRGVPSDPGQAAAYYLKAAKRGSKPAEDRLWAMMKADIPAGSRAFSILTLSRVALGWKPPQANVDWSYQYLSTHNPDWEGVNAIGLLMEFGYRVDYMNFKSAYFVFEQCADHGSREARVLQAKDLAEGIGVKKDLARAFSILKPLADQGIPDALDYYGAYHFWGIGGSDGIKPDPQLTFAFVAAAADAGAIWAPRHLADSYFFGIGTKTNYALAAKYYHLAWNNGTVGHVLAERLMQRCLAAVSD